MLKFINNLYKKDRVTLDLVEAINKKLALVEKSINDLYKQIFLNSATWYLAQKEKEMDIAKPPDDIDKRRAYVRARLLGTGTATKEMLEGVANSVPGVKAEIIFKDMNITINFLHVENNKYMGVCKKAVGEMMPYHLGLNVQYSHINWSELKDCTWGAVKNYTWGSVSESVAGTIIGGIDDDFG